MRTFFAMQFIRKNSIRVLGSLLLMFMFFSCDDNTDTLGVNVMPPHDNVLVSQATYNVFTKSTKIDSLVANTSECYLGRVTDPETNATTTCNFLAQFYSLDQYKLPSYDMMHKEDGKVVADSIELRLYINSFYGDSLNSIKIGVYELDSAHVMEENEVYYTNIAPEQYVSKKHDAIQKEISFAVADLSLSDSIRFSSSYNKSILVKLPASYGSKILNKYYQNPNYFKNSYNFIHYVCPGFLFKVISGNGTLVNVDVSTMSVYFKYTQNDSTYVGVQRVAATEEVIQNNQIQNTNIDDLLNEQNYTFLKTPAGIFTEATLPINEIYRDHEADSVNSAKIVFKRQNNSSVNQYNLSTPSTILMILKKDLNSFFENQEVPDGYKNYVANFEQTYNSFTFSNIANLISYLKRTRDQGAGVLSSDTQTEKEQKITQWESKNPEWNKIVLVPITTEKTTLGAIINAYNDFSLTNTRLIGGENNPISISIVYSQFKK